MFPQPSLGQWSARQALYEVDRKRIAETNAQAAADASKANRERIRHNARILRPKMKGLNKEERADFAMKVRMGIAYPLYAVINAAQAMSGAK